MLAYITKVSSNYTWSVIMKTLTLLVFLLPAIALAVEDSTVVAIDSKPKELNPLSLSFHVGMNNPTSSFGNNLDSGTSLGVDLEYLFNSKYAMELFLGSENFKGVSGNSDTDVSHLSINVKRYSTYLIHRYFVQAGIGNYNFDPGQTHWGQNVGAGFQWNPALPLTFEATFKYHNINAGNSTEFSTFHVGTRFRF